MKRLVGFDFDRVWEWNSVVRYLEPIVMSVGSLPSLTNSVKDTNVVSFLIFLSISFTRTSPPQNPLTMCPNARQDGKHRKFFWPPLRLFLRYDDWRLVRISMMMSGLGSNGWCWVVLGGAGWCWMDSTWWQYFDWLVLVKLKNTFLGQSNYSIAPCFLFRRVFYWRRVAISPCWFLDADPPLPSWIGRGTASRQGSPKVCPDYCQPSSTWSTWDSKESSTLSRETSNDPRWPSIWMGKERGTHAAKETAARVEAKTETEHYHAQTEARWSEAWALVCQRSVGQRGKTKRGNSANVGKRKTTVYS